MSPPKDLTVGEVTSDTVNLSWLNDMLVTEYLVTYGPTQPGGLLSDLTVPGDQTGTTLKDLEPGLEYRVNVYAALGKERSVPVGASVATGTKRLTCDVRLLQRNLIVQSRSTN